MYDQIAKQIETAAKNRSKVAMFHYQVLINADKLSEENPVDFCRAVGMEDSFATEFRKMIRLAKFMKRMGARINT